MQNACQNAHFSRILFNPLLLVTVLTLLLYARDDVRISIPFENSCRFLQISNFILGTFWNFEILLCFYSLYLPRLENLEKKIPLCILKSYVVLYPRSNFQLSVRDRPPTTNCICCSHARVYFVWTSKTLAELLNWKK